MTINDNRVFKFSAPIVPCGRGPKLTLKRDFTIKLLIHQKHLFLKMIICVLCISRHLELGRPNPVSFCPPRQGFYDEGRTAGSPPQVLDPVDSSHIHIVDNSRLLTIDFFYGWPMDMLSQMVYLSLFAGGRKLVYVAAGFTQKHLHLLPVKINIRCRINLPHATGFGWSIQQSVAVCRTAKNLPGQFGDISKPEALDFWHHISACISLGSGRSLANGRSGYIKRSSPDFISGRMTVYPRESSRH